ncbi:MAG: deoxyribose-phosphate aldolase [Syntrophomonas sp.]
MLAGYIDSTNLKADAQEQDIKLLCEQAARHKMAAVCVNPYRLPLAAECLTSSEVKLCTVIGFPLGAEHSSTKLYAARLALQQGAQELDLVMNIGAFLERNYHHIRAEIKSLLILKNDYDFALKVIVETAMLSEVELRQATELVSNTQADFIKTSTGYASRGVSLKDIEIINVYKCKNLKIKASGGIKDLDFALQLIAAGVDRIGSSNALHLLEEYSQRGGLEGR